MNKEDLKKLGLKKGTKLVNYMPDLFAEKHKYEYENLDEIESVKVNEYGEVEVRTKFTKSITEINGKEVPEKDRVFVLDNPKVLEIVSTKKLPEKIAGEEFEIENGFVDFESVTIPGELIKALAHTFNLLKIDEEEWDEVLDLEDIKVNFNDFELTVKDIKTLSDGLRNLD
jgi:hypothetical protein